MERVTVVDCVYRLDVKGELIPGKYDLEKDCIIGTEAYSIAHDRAPAIDELYEYLPGNYDGTYTTLDIIALYSALMRSKDALIAINYNNIGAILVSERAAIRFLSYPDTYSMEHERHQPLFRPVTAIGTLKAPVYSLAAMQPIMNICVFTLDGKPYSATRYGMLEVDSELFQYAGPTHEGYARMFEDTESGIYGICTLAGDRRVIIREGNKLKVG